MQRPPLTHHRRVELRLLLLLLLLLGRLVGLEALGRLAAGAGRPHERGCPRGHQVAVPHHARARGVGGHAMATGIEWV